MVISGIAFAAGVLLFQQSPFLPAAHWLLLPIILILILLPWRRWRPLAWFGFGLFWAHACALLQMPASLGEPLWGRDLIVEGRVLGLPSQEGDSVRFLFAADSIRDADKIREGDWRLRLTWYRAPSPVTSGERWRLKLRIKPARTYANPGSFDYQGWLYRQGVRYTGYVRTGTANQRLATAAPLSLDVWREELSNRVGQAPVSETAAGLLRALTVGDRGGLSQTHWQVFSRTGTNHLVAISGLHVGLVAGMLMWLVSWAWRRVPVFCSRWPASHAAAWAGLMAALGYAALAGFSIPTQRAFLMLLVLLGAVLLRRPLTTGRGLALALVVVLLFDPSAVLAQGFWLSFAAVGVILLSLNRVASKPSRAGQWLWLQLTIAIGLAPLLLFFYQQLPLAAPLVNLIAIPVFGFLIVPLALLAVMALALSTDLADLLFRAAGWLADQAFWALQLVANEPGLTLRLPGPAIGVLLLALAGVLLVLLPRGMPGRAMGLVLCLPLFVGKDNRPLPGDFRFTMLDVGQGTSAVVETHGHLLVYDTGPGFRSGFNTGSAVVAPFLHQAGWQGMDILILSHGDKDHAGGARGLLDQISAERILSGEPGRLAGIQSEACHAGQQWHWDGVKFEILHPRAGADFNGNDASCVLQIGNAAGRVLLTGDIEASVEAMLLPVLAGQSVDVLSVPHHGSRTSSSQAFVEASGAAEVVVSAGWRNRYGFPLPDIAERWRLSGARLWNTADSGALSYEFRADGTHTDPTRFRRQRRRYWQTD